MNGRRFLERSGQVFYNVGLVLLGYTLGAALESSFAAWSLGRQLERSLQFSARGEVARSAPPPGGVIGRLEIPRLGLNTVIIKGAEASALRSAAGHIPGTALPGSPGNVGIAGHRDQSFRRLKDAQTGDWIMVVTPEGSFHYRIASLSVVSPRQTSVLAASKEPKLTLVTCYPFHYVGRAPQRFIVEAREVAPVPEAPRRARSRQGRAAVAWHGRMALADDPTLGTARYLDDSASH